MNQGKLSQALVGCRAGFILLAVLIAASPCWAWLYDGGPTQHAGAQLRDDTNCQWVVEPFTVAQDSYATTLGAAVARGMGPADAGYNLYLTTTLYGLPGSAFARISAPIIPLNTQYVYYDSALDAPVLLHASVVYGLVVIPTTTNLIGSISWGNVSGSYYGLKTGDYGQTWVQTERPFCVRVDGYPVPEPASVLALAGGLLLLLRRRS